jgi:serine/threonine protein kinase
LEYRYTKIICPNCGEENKQEDKKCNICKANLLLNNKYHLVKVLGENIGITYIAVESFSVFENLRHRKIIIKELSIKSIDRWKTEELFKREGNVLKSLNHDAIPKFIEQFTIDINKNTAYFLVMEFIEGKTLEEELKEKIYNEEEVFSLIKEIVEILGYLHSFRPPIIHRDIKPSNLIRKPDGKLVLIDFGGVKDAVKPNIGSTVAGTFGYAAPEQILARPVVQSDFYSLGILALVLLTKKDVSELVGNIDLSSQTYNFLSNKIISLIDKLIANKVSDRFQNTSEILSFFDENEKKFKERNLSPKVVKSDRDDIEVLLDGYEKLINEFFRLKKYYFKKIATITLAVLGLIVAASIVFSSAGILGIAIPLFIFSFSFYSNLIFKKFLKNANKITNDPILIHVASEYVYDRVNIFDKKEEVFSSFDSIYEEHITNHNTLDKGDIMIYKKIIDENFRKKI